MTTDEAIRILQDMYRRAAATREQSLQFHLFGIKYADELEGWSTPTLREIAGKATGSHSSGDEIYKGRRLAKYVTLKPGV